MPDGSESPFDFPWLAEAWAALDAYVVADRVPQALLLLGSSGVGKRILADSFAGRLLCDEPAAQLACGLCVACRLLAAGTHPDLIVVAPAEPGKGLKVEVVRETISALALRPHRSRHRIVIFPQAGAMNRYAANSLLKALEEPTLETRFLLLAERLGEIPATIRSRCQVLRVTIPNRDLALNWMRQRLPALPEVTTESLLALADGAPLRAISLDPSRVEGRREIFGSFIAVAGGSADPVVAAAAWERFGAEAAVQCIISWLEDLIRIRSGAVDHAATNPDFTRSLKSIAEGRGLRTLFRCLDLSYRAKALLSGQANRLLLLEELAIHWAGVAIDA